MSLFLPHSLPGFYQVFTTFNTDTIGLLPLLPHKSYILLCLFTFYFFYFFFKNFIGKISGKSGKNKETKASITNRRVFKIYVNSPVFGGLKKNKKKIKIRKINNKKQVISGKNLVKTW